MYISLDRAYFCKYQDVCLEDVHYVQANGVLQWPLHHVDAETCCTNYKDLSCEGRSVYHFASLYKFDV